MALVSVANPYEQFVLQLAPPEEETFTLLEPPPDPLLAELYPPPPGDSDSNPSPCAVPTTARTQSSLAPMLSPPCVTPSPRSARAATRTGRSARGPGLLSARGEAVGPPMPPLIDYRGLERAFDRLRTASASIEKKQTRRIGRIALKVSHQNSPSTASPLLSPKQSIAQPSQSRRPSITNAGGVLSGGVANGNAENGVNGNGNVASLLNGTQPQPVRKRFLREIKTIEGSRQERIARISKMLSLIIREGDIEQLIEGLEMYSNTDEYPVNFANARVCGEPLLVTAIKHHQKVVARELVERGADPFQGVRTIDLNRRSSSIDVFYTTPRELAYQHGMYDLVDQIDAIELAERFSDPTLAASKRVSWLYRNPESPLGMRPRAVQPPAFEATSAHSEPLNPYLQRSRQRRPLHSVKSYSALPTIATNQRTHAQVGILQRSRNVQAATSSYSVPVDETLATTPRSNTSAESVVRHTGTKSRTMRHSSRD